MPRDNTTVTSPLTSKNSFSDYSNYTYDGTLPWDYDLGDFNPDLIFNDLGLDVNLDLQPFNVALIVLYSIVFILGLLGNVFVVAVIIKFRSMRTLTNFFLVNLTIGDILVIVICIPVTLGGTIYKNWIYGEVLCKLTPFIQGSAVGVSVLSLLSISISRYFAIYKPLTAKIIFSKRNVRFMLIGIWVASFVSFSPLLFVNSTINMGIPGLFEKTMCQESWEALKDKQIYNIFIFCILFMWPFLLMAIFYTVIGHTLWIGNTVLFTQESKVHQNRNNQILKQRRRTVKMLICVIAIFGFCWLPYYIVNIWIDFAMNDQSKAETLSTVLQFIYPVAVLLGLGNSAVNPICYCFMSHGFRRGFNKIFCHGFLRRSGSFFRSSWKFRSTVLSDSIETADV